MKKYYSTLSKDKKKEVKNKFREEYQNTLVTKRLSRLKIYAIIGYVFGILLLAYTLSFENKLSDIILGIILIILGITYTIGIIIVKKRYYNKIALALKEARKKA